MMNVLIVVFAAVGIFDGIATRVALEAFTVWMEEHNCPVPSTAEAAQAFVCRYFNKK